MRIHAKILTFRPTPDQTTMNYDLVLSELRQASPFDLFRLQAAIGKLLDDPGRLTAIKHRLRPGMELTYFSTQENRLIPARLLEIRKTRVAVQDLESGKRWTIPLYMINLENVDADLTPQRNKADRLTLRINDRVGFKGRDGREIFGHVIKLNPKRARIKAGDTIWNVPYSLLFTVIDGEQGEDLLIPAGPGHGIPLEP